jgi:hypothetical protein
MLPFVEAPVHLVIILLHGEGVHNVGKRMLWCCRACTVRCVVWHDACTCVRMAEQSCNQIYISVEQGLYSRYIESHVRGLVIGQSFCTVGIRCDLLLVPLDFMDDITD